jgi:hypothetical protein
MDSPSLRLQLTEAGFSLACFSTQHFLMWEEPSRTNPTNQFAWPEQKATVRLQNALWRKHITTWSDNEITVIWLVTVFKAFYFSGILLALAWLQGSHLGHACCIAQVHRQPSRMSGV